MKAGIGLIEKVSNIDDRMELIQTLRTVSEGKMHVEVENARLTRMLAKVHEEGGRIAEAGDLLQEVQVETYGSMDRKEKIDFILEQIRLCLIRRDYIRASIVSNKIDSKKAFKGASKDKAPPIPPSGSTRKDKAPPNTHSPRMPAFHHASPRMPRHATAATPRAKKGNCGSNPATKESDEERDRRGGEAACAAVRSPTAPACVAAADREEEAARPPQSAVPQDGPSGPPAATPEAPASGAAPSKTTRRAGPTARPFPRRHRPSSPS